jgi:hypothetical protein
MSLIFRVVLRLNVFENRVLKRIFGLKKEEVTGCRRKLHNEEFHNLNSSSSICRIREARTMRLTRDGAGTGRK